MVKDVLRQKNIAWPQSGFLVSRNVLLDHPAGFKVGRTKIKFITIALPRSRQNTLDSFAGDRSDPGCRVLHAQKPDPTNAAATCKKCIRTFTAMPKIETNC